MTPLDCALYQVSLGRRVVALHGVVRGRCTCGRVECGHSAGKHPYYPLCPNGLHDATKDPDVVRRWFAEVPALNYGVVWGRESGAFAVDLDIKPAEGIDGRETWYDLSRRWGGEPNTETVITGSGGLHLIFAYPDLPPGVRIAPNQGVLGPGIDVRGDDSYTVGPGCSHASGRRYEYETASDPEDAEEPVGAAGPPDGLVELVTARARDNRPVPEVPEGGVSCEEGWRALRGPLAQLTEAPDGERLSARCAAGMRAGRLVAAGLLCAQEALDALVKVAIENTTRPEREVRRTIANYLRIGLKYPWEPTRPVREEAPPPPSDDDAPEWAREPEPVPKPAAPGEQTASNDPWLCWATVVPRSVRWLWTGYVPTGKVTVLAGAPGTSKTTLCLMIAAAVTRGTRLPGDNLDDPIEGTVGVISTEDDVDDTLVPRAEAAGADLSQIASWRDSYLLPTLPSSLDALIRWIQARSIRLLVIDPLSILKDDGVDSHKDADVRRVMGALKAAASVTGCAVVGIAHLNKSQATTAIGRVGGSGAWVAAARSALLCSQDPEGGQDDLLISVVKSNLARARATSRLRRVTVGDPDGAVYRLEWLGTSEATADELVCGATRGRPAAARSAAGEWLASELAGGSRLATDLYDAAEVHGIAKATLLRAKAELGVRSAKNFAAKWMWQIDNTKVINPPRY